MEVCNLNDCCCANTYNRKVTQRQGYKYDFSNTWNIEMPL